MWGGGCISKLWGSFHDIYIKSSHCTLYNFFDYTSIKLKKDMEKKAIHFFSMLNNFTKTFCNCLELTYLRKNLKSYLKLFCTSQKGACFLTWWHHTNETLLLLQWYVLYLKLQGMCFEFYSTLIEKFFFEYMKLSLLLIASKETCNLWPLM